MKKLISLILLCVLLLASCAPGTDISDVSDAESGSEAAPSLGVDTGKDACVTDASGEFGVVIDRKDVKTLPYSFGCILIQPGAETDITLGDGMIAVAVKSRISGGFEVVEYDAKKISTKYFTLIFKGERETEFAKAYLTLGKVCNMHNTDKITRFGTGFGITVAGKDYAVDALCPEEATGGVTVYDESYGFGVSPEYDGDFVDILVFDGYVLEKRGKNETTVLPFPSGCLIRFAGDAAEYADGINEGDRVEAVGFEIECSPTSYVLINGCKVEIAYRNEHRSEVAYAVLYDSGYAYDSTRTNVWGTEVAVDRDGFITEVVPGATANVSGDTAIPEGGFVLSSGKPSYEVFMSSSKVGDKAEYIQKSSAYSHRRIYDVKFGVYGAAGEEYIAVIRQGTVQQVDGAIYYTVGSDGCVSGIGTSPAVIPEGGSVIVATGMKKTELKRFCALGDKVVCIDSASAVSVLGKQTVMSVSDMLETLEKDASAAKKALKELDFAAIDALIAAARSHIGSGDAGIIDAAKAIEQANKLLVPSVTVSERAAWVIDTDSDTADVKRTVAYAVELGINTLILSPFRNSYALYNTSVPHLYRSKDTGDFDVLQAYVDECHKNGIKLIFMLCTFDTKKPSGDYEADHFVNYFADKLLISKKGRDAAYFYGAASYSLNPFDSEVGEFYKSIVKEVLQNYDVDGIQLDAIRFPLPTFYDVDKYEDQGYNDDIISAFQKKYRTDRNPKDFSITEPIWEDWCEFRRDIISDFVKEVGEICEDVEFSCTCFPANKDRQYYVFQDAEKWAINGYIDAIYPMSYTASFDEFVSYISPLAEAIDGRCRIVAGIGTYDGETDAVLAKQLEHAYSVGCDGVSVFALQYIQSCYFDGFYLNAFRETAVDTADPGKAFKAYARALLSKTNGVYAYIYPNAELSELVSLLSAASESVTPENAKETFESILAFAEAADLPEDVKADIKKQISHILSAISRLK